MISWVTIAHRVGPDTSIAFLPKDGVLAAAWLPDAHLAPCMGRKWRILAWRKCREGIWHKGKEAALEERKMKRYLLQGQRRNRGLGGPWLRGMVVMEGGGRKG